MQYFIGKVFPQFSSIIPEIHPKIASHSHCRRSRAIVAKYTHLCSSREIRSVPPIYNHLRCMFHGELYWIDSRVHLAAR